MAARLQYELSVIGEDRLKRVLRGVGAELKAAERHSAAVARKARAAPSSGAGRGFAEIARAANAAMKLEGQRQNQALGGLARIGATARRIEDRRHMQAMRNQQREVATNLRGIASIGAAARKIQEREHRRNMRDLERRRTRTSEAVRSYGRGAAASVGNAVVGTGRMLAGGAALVGGFAAERAVRSRIDVASQATDLANQAFGNPGEKRSREQIRREVLQQVANIDAASGIGEEGLIQGLRSFTAISGELGTGQQMLPFLARLSDATGADIGELGAVGGQVLQAVQLSGEKDPTKQLQKTQEIIAQIAMQSKIGSIEMADFASQISKITSAAGQFDGDAGKLVTTMSALGQMAIAGGASSPEEAATAIARLPADIIKNAGAKGDLGKLKINAFTDKTKTKVRDPVSIMLDVLEKTGGDLTKVQGIFDERSRKAFDPIRKTFVEAEEKKKGSGRQAVMEKLAPFMQTLTPQEIAAGAQFKRGTDERELAKVSGEFSRAVGDALIPALRELTPVVKELKQPLAEAAKFAADFVKGFAESPIEGVGKIIAAKVALDLAGAGIGAAASGGLSAALGTITSMLMGGISSVRPDLIPKEAVPALPNVVAAPLGLAKKGFTGFTSKLTSMGKMGTGIAGGLALAGLYAAWDQGKQLYDETGGFTDRGKDRARASTPEEYDAMMKKAGLAQPAVNVNTADADQKLAAVAGAAENAAAKLNAIGGVETTNPRRFKASSQR